jgi:hypothetical protein
MQLEEAAAGRGPGAPRPPAVPGAGVGTPVPDLVCPGRGRASGRLPVARRRHGEHLENNPHGTSRLVPVYTWVGHGLYQRSVYT